MAYRQLTAAFLRIGLLGYGGGPSMIPLVHAEAVRKYGWLTDEEFADVLAMGNALPGPIATKMASYIGYKVGGAAGAAIAVCAMVLPVAIGMIALLGAIYRLKDSGVVEGMTRGIQPVIGVMMAVMAWEFLRKSWQSEPAIRWMALMAVSCGALLVWSVNPGIVIGAMLAFAAVETAWRVQRTKRPAPAVAGDPLAGPVEQAGPESQAETAMLAEAAATAVLMAPAVAEETVVPATGAETETAASEGAPAGVSARASADAAEAKPPEHGDGRTTP